MKPTMDIATAENGWVVTETRYDNSNRATSEFFIFEDAHSLMIHVNLWAEEVQTW